MQYTDLVTQMKPWPISINIVLTSLRQARSYSESMFLFGDSV